MKGVGAEVKRNDLQDLCTSLRVDLSFSLLSFTHHSVFYFLPMGAYMLSNMSFSS